MRASVKPKATSTSAIGQAVKAAATLVQAAVTATTTAAGSLDLEAVSAKAKVLQPFGRPAR